MRGQKEAKGRRTTKAELQAELARMTVDLSTAQAASVQADSVAEALRTRLQERDEDLAEMDRAMDAANEGFGEFQRLLRESDNVGRLVSRQLHSEVERGARNEVLIKALVALLARPEIGIGEAIDSVRDGAALAGVDPKVAVEVLDQHFRREVIEQAVDEAEGVRLPVASPASGDFFGMDSGVAGVMGAELLSMLEGVGLGKFVTIDPVSLLHR